MKPKKNLPENVEPSQSTVAKKWHQQVSFWIKKIWNDPVWSSVIATLICVALYRLSPNIIVLIIGLAVVVFGITATIKKYFTHKQSSSKYKNSPKKIDWSRVWKAILATLPFLAILVTITGYTAKDLVMFWQNGKSYTISFYDEATIVNEVNYTKNTDAFSLDSIQKEGCEFGGWYNNENKTGEPILDIPKGSKGHMMFWGEWIPLKYLVAFFTDGGSPIPIDTSYTIESDDLLLPKDLTKRGYYFKGRSLGWSTLTVDRIPMGSTGDKKLWALWEKVLSTPSEISTGAQVLVENPQLNIAEPPIIITGYAREQFSKEKAEAAAMADALQKLKDNYFPNVDIAVIRRYAIPKEPKATKPYSSSETWDATIEVKISEISKLIKMNE